MAEVTIKGRSLIKQVTESTETGSDYLTYVPLSGELVCVNADDSAYLVKGDGNSVVKDCTKVGGSDSPSVALQFIKDSYKMSITENAETGDINRVVTTSITDFTTYDFAIVSSSDYMNSESGESGEVLYGFYSIRQEEGSTLVSCNILTRHESMFYDITNGELSIDNETKQITLPMEYGADYDSENVGYSITIQFCKYTLN